jgi:hypothetical protein
MMTGARIPLLPADEAKAAASDADVSEYMAGFNIFDDQDPVAALPFIDIGAQFVEDPHIG